MSAITTPIQVYATLMPSGAEPLADPAVAARTRSRARCPTPRSAARTACRSARRRARRPGKLVAHERPGDDEAEHGVDASPRRATRRTSGGTRRARAARSRCARTPASGKLAPFITSAAIGTSTITARNMPAKPSVRPKPGNTLGLTQPLTAAMVQPQQRARCTSRSSRWIPTPRQRRFDRRRRRH